MLTLLIITNYLINIIKDMYMTKSIEDCLELIYIIALEKKSIRVKELSSRLKITKPSIVSTLKELKNMNLISQEKYGYIELTEDGIREAKKILNKHNIIKKFLIDTLKVSDDNAEKDACQMEHFLSNETLSKIEEFIRNK